MIERVRGNSLLFVILCVRHLVDDVVDHFLGKAVAFKRSFNEDIAVAAAGRTVLRHLDHVRVGAHAQFLDHVALLTDYQAYTVVRNRQQERLYSSYVIARRSSIGGHRLVLKEVGGEWVKLQLPSDRGHLDSGRVGRQLRPQLLDVRGN